MINIGEFNILKVARKSDFGYYLDLGTGSTSDDILLPNRNTLDQQVEVGAEVNAFIYKDSLDRLVATLKEPLAKVGEVALLKVVDSTKIGYFINFGLEKDILVPFKEITYTLEVGKSYLFYVYLDKTDRLAATTYVDRHLHHTNVYKVGDEVEALVYGIQQTGNLMLAIDGLYRAIIFKGEIYRAVRPGETIGARVSGYLEDGKIILSARKEKLEEMNDVEEQIMEYLKENQGKMIYGDKSDPEDIKDMFRTSKNSFKRALGGLMKKGLICQNEKGTYLKED
ncbi:MAG: S1-like domain-containing RNA-binding protein [Clostridium sp.]